MEKEDNQVLLKFVIGPYQFCAPAVDVIAIIQPPDFTQVPLSLHYVPGLFNYQDEVGMGICMRRKLGLQPHQSISDGHFLISKLDGGLVGFWIDEAVDLYDANTFDRRDVITWIGHDYHDAFLIEDNEDNNVVLSTNFDILYRARASTRIIEQVLVRQEDVPEKSQESLPQEIDAMATKSGSEKIPADTENSNSATSEKTVPKDKHDEHQTKAQPLPVAARVSGSDIITPGYEQTSHVSGSGEKFTGQGKSQNQGQAQNQGSNARALLGKHSGDQLHQTGHASHGVASPATGYKHSSIAGTTAKTKTRQNSYNSAANKIAAKNKTHSQTSRYVNGHSGMSADETGHQVGRHMNFDKHLESNEAAYHHPRTERQSYHYDSDIIDQKDLNNDVEKRILTGLLIACLLGLLYWLWPESGDKQTPATKYAVVSKYNTDTNVVSESPAPDSELTNNFTSRTPDELTNSIPEQSIGGSDLALNNTGITATPAEKETINELASDSGTIDQNQADTDISVGTGADTDSLNILNQDDLHISIEKPDGIVQDVIASNDGYSLQAQADPDLSSVSPGLNNDSAALAEVTDLEDTLPVAAYETFTHTVVKGDTLWDIAAHYLNNPFRYPLLASLSNIKDPHWIYPGDIVHISRKKEN